MVQPCMDAVGFNVVTSPPRRILRYDAPMFKSARERRAPVAGRGKRFVSVAAALIVAAAGLTGCTGLEPALLGAAASGVQAGSSVSSAGKVNAAWIADFHQVIRAGEAMFNDLGFTITSSTGNADEGKWIIVGSDEDKDKFKFKVWRETDKLCRYQINVGWFGSRPVARLMVKRVAINLYDQGLVDGGDIPVE